MSIQTRFQSTDPSLVIQIRNLLDLAERDIVVMHDSPTGARDVILNVFRIQQLLNELNGPQYDTRAEESRVHDLHQRLLRESSRVVRLVRANGHTEELADNPLWQEILETHAARRKRQNVRMAITIGSLVTVFLLLFVVLPRLFPPAPTINANVVAQLAAQGEIGDALALAEAERERVPTDPDGPLWLGALYTANGDQAAAEAAWADARELLGNDEVFFLERGLLLTQVAEYSAAEADARTLIAMPESEAQGYYLLGHVSEARGDVAGAVTAFEQSSELAQERNNPELVVASRTRLAFLLQRLNIAPSPGP